jgi:site-specific recombinase XerD
MIRSRRGWRMHHWPPTDQQLWDQAKAGSYLAGLHANTVNAVANAYGRWLAFMASGPGLDSTLHPADRVAEETVRMYIRHIRAAGRSQATIVCNVERLRSAMRIVAPDRVFGWMNPSRFGDDLPLAAPKRRKDPLQDLPETDRQLWQAGLTPGDILTGQTYAARLSPATIRTNLNQYRHWLAFLRAAKRLDLTMAPATRVTQENIIAYVEALQARQCNASIIAQLTALRSALRILCPKADFGWLTRPGGVSLHALFPTTKRSIRLVDSKALYEWGHALMREAIDETSSTVRPIKFRNGLLIAIFAARAPRVRSMASLRLGRTVVKRGPVYQLIFGDEDVKTRRVIEYDAPIGLSEAIDRYIAVDRIELRPDTQDNAFWISARGRVLTIAQISAIIRRESKRRFGFSFGPHRFRHALGTSAPLTDPAHPGVAAAILGISPKMVEAHYNRASQAQVAGRFLESLCKQRVALKARARREFQNRFGREQ